jgi:hypothetical protein
MTAVISAPRLTAPVPNIAMEELVLGFKPFTIALLPVKNPHPNGPSNRKPTSGSALVRLFTLVIEYVEKEPS